MVNTYWFPSRHQAQSIRHGEEMHEIQVSKNSQYNRRQERNHEITDHTLSRIPMTSESASIKSGLVQGEAVAQNIQGVNERLQGRVLEMGRGVLQRMSGKRSICGLKEEQSVGADGMPGIGLSKTQHLGLIYFEMCHILACVSGRPSWGCPQSCESWDKLVAGLWIASCLSRQNHLGNPD